MELKLLTLRGGDAPGFGGGTCALVPYCGRVALGTWGLLAGGSMVPSLPEANIESQNHRIVGVGRDLCGSSSPTPCPSRVTYSRLHRTGSRRGLNISREGDSTTSLGSLGQCSVHPGLLHGWLVWGLGG